MDVMCRIVDDEKGRQDAFAIRYDVFVAEQGVPAEIEIDDWDEEAIHVVAYVGDQPVGTGRVVVVHESTARIGRMAVRREWRNRGIGQEILKRLIGMAQEAGAGTIRLHAQSNALRFYTRNGFVAIGTSFIEAGIEHFLMELVLEEVPSHGC